MQKINFYKIHKYYYEHEQCCQQYHVHSEQCCQQHHVHRDSTYHYRPSSQSCSDQYTGTVFVRCNGSIPASRNCWCMALSRNWLTGGQRWWDFPSVTSIACKIDRTNSGSRFSRGAPGHVRQWLFTYKSIYGVANLLTWSLLSIHAVRGTQLKEQYNFYK